MKLNAFKVRTGKPMISSLQDAQEFLSQCKVSFDLKLQDGKILLTFFGGDDDIPCKVGKYERLNEGIDTEVTAWYGEEAIKKCYEYREYINNYFSKETKHKEKLRGAEFSGETAKALAALIRKMAMLTK